MDNLTENCKDNWEIINEDSNNEEEILVESEYKLTQMNNDLLDQNLLIKTLQDSLLISKAEKEEKDRELEEKDRDLEEKDRELNIVYDVIKSKEQCIINNEKTFDCLDSININLKKILDEKDIEIDKLLKFSSDLNYNETQYRKEIKCYKNLIDEKEDVIDTLVVDLENKALQCHHYDNLLETLTHHMNLQSIELDIIKKREEIEEIKKHFFVKFYSHNNVGLSICSNANLQSSIHHLTFVSEIAQNSEAYRVGIQIGDIVISVTIDGDESRCYSYDEFIQIKNEMSHSKEYSFTFHFFRPTSTALLQQQIKCLVKYIYKKDETIKELTECLVKNSIENIYEEKYKGKGYQDISLKEELRRKEDEIFEMKIFLSNKMTRIIELECMLNEMKKIKNEKKEIDSGLIIKKFVCKKLKRVKSSSKIESASTICMKDLILHSNKKSVNNSGIRDYYSSKDINHPVKYNTRMKTRKINKQYENNILQNIEDNLEDYYDKLALL